VNKPEAQALAQSSIEETGL